MALVDRQFIEGGLIHHSERGLLAVFVALTEDTHARDFVGSGHALTLFTRDLSRYTVGRVRRLPWCAVGEVHRGHTIHWHLLVAGLCAPWDKKTAAVFRPHLRKADGSQLRTGDTLELLGRTGIVASKEETIKPLVVKHGFGSGFKGLRQVGFDGGDIYATAGYMSKYLSKGDAGDELPKGFQLVRSSRGRSAWWPGHTLTELRRENTRCLSMRNRAVVAPTNIVSPS